MSNTYKATRDFFDQHAANVTHVAVAHTRYTTYDRCEAGMARIVELAKNDCRHFRSCFNKVLYGKRAQRKPKLYQPLILATLEGSLVTSDPNLTLHYNFSMGNLPSEMTDDDLRNAMRACWVGLAGQRDDIYIENVVGRLERVKGWIGYSLKEAELHRNHDVWDFENTQIPHDALAAG
ncbi:hypothetical protein ACWA7J_06020 [Leptothrix sp. BB-4]